jgi:hypothetical protein
MRSPQRRAGLAHVSRLALAPRQQEDERPPRTVHRETQRVARSNPAGDPKRNVNLRTELCSKDLDQPVHSCRATFRDRSDDAKGSKVDAMGWTHCMGRSIIGAAVAGLTAVTVVVLPLGTASGSPCDGSSCVPHVRTDAVEGASCEAARVYPFGLDAQGNTLICYATYRNPTKTSWSSVPQLVGVRDYGALCSGKGVAQSPDGLPLVCRDSIWDRYTPDLPVG